jgi:hypothetical protein
MVYSNKLVVSLKVDGKFLRDSKDSENNNEVFVPFGSEYSIFIKNLHSERALVDIDVDGETAITGLVVDSKNDASYTINWCELERFHKGDNSSGHRFKFIEKTKEISEHRGDDPEDGLIVVRYRFELPKPTVRYGSTITFRGGTGSPQYGDHTLYSSSNVTRSASRGEKMGMMADAGDASESLDVGANFMHAAAAPMSDAGITVEGSQSNQAFQTTTFGATETIQHSIVLKLRGVIEEQKVVKPITTRTRVTCKSCGKKCETSWKMCSQCGTSVKASAAA